MLININFNQLIMRKLFTCLAISIVQLSFAQTFQFRSSNINFELTLSCDYSLNEDSSIITIETDVNRAFSEKLRILPESHFDLPYQDREVRFYTDSLFVKFLELPSYINSSIGDSGMFSTHDWAEMYLSGRPSQVTEQDLKYQFVLATYALASDSIGSYYKLPNMYITIPDTMLPQLRLKVVACTDPTACNYYSETTPNDDKSSCVYPTALDACASCSGDIDGTGTIVDNDSDDDGVCDADESVGVNELREFELDLYPNPSDNKLFIRSSEFLEKLQVQVVNVTGKIERRLNLVNIQDNEPYELDLENLSPGLYMIKTSSETKTISLPWVKY